MRETDEKSTILGTLDDLTGDCLVLMDKIVEARDGVLRNHPRAQQALALVERAKGELDSLVSEIEEEEEREGQE